MCFLLTVLVIRAGNCIPSVRVRYGRTRWVVDPMQIFMSRWRSG